MINLPYLYVDDEYDLNCFIALLVIKDLSITSRGSYKLTFDKIQFFIYLVKNPSKINQVLEAADKKFSAIENNFSYTIESLSVNVDVLYDRSRTKQIIKRLVKIGAVKVHKDKKDGVMYYLSEQGNNLLIDLNNEYYMAVSDFIKRMKPLQSLNSVKLFTVLRLVFKRDY